PGNYQRLSGIAKKIPIYPDLVNERSMLFIDNLSIFIDYYISNNFEGVYLPQNNEYINTTKLINTIRISQNLKIRKTKLFNWFVYIAMIFSPQLKKVFGSL